MFVIIAALHGDAINGHEAGGHYFLGSHGKFTEVSHDVFFFSAGDVLLTIGLHIVTLISAIINLFVPHPYKVTWFARVRPWTTSK